MCSPMLNCNFLGSVLHCMDGGNEQNNAEGTKAVNHKPPVNRVKVEKLKKDRNSLVASILGRETGVVTDDYLFLREIGKGQFGTTSLVSSKKTGEQFACKTVAKRKLFMKDDVEDVRREVAVMHHLAGQANCKDQFVQLKGAYEDKQNVYLITELCSGGELFDRIIAKGKYSERSAAAVCRNIVSIVETCHSSGVMHRDLKPENFLYFSKKEDSLLRLADFGTSVFFKPGETFSDIKGSSYYVAPEVLRRKYGPEADVWSCGVILYILLCGVPPFWAENEEGVFDAILHGMIDFKSDPWPRVSEQAKDLIRKMLNQNPKERPTPSQILRHPWIKVGGSAPDKALDSSVVARLKHFSAMNKMKKLALKVIASHLSEEEIVGLRKMFEQMDTDSNGTITYAELKAGLAIYGANMPEEQIKLLMEGADVDHTGSINYKEFITATISMNKDMKEENLFKAFKHFDQDGSGYITMDELRKALQEDGELEEMEIENIIREVDSDKDGKIDYEEFSSMMRRDGDSKSRTNSVPTTPRSSRRY